MDTLPAFPGCNQAEPRPPKPLTFFEYLQFNNIAVVRRDSQLLDSHFHSFVRDGGLPENVVALSRDHLTNLVDDIIQRDITAFHGLKDHQVIRDYFTLLMERSGKKVYACDLGVKYLFIGNGDWGSYFENYVYLRIRARQPVFYVRSDGNELDFLTGDGTLIEAKYNAPIEGAQKVAFDEYPAERKLLIQSVRDLLLRTHRRV